LTCSRPITARATKEQSLPGRMLAARPEYLHYPRARVATSCNCHSSCSTRSRLRIRRIPARRAAKSGRRSTKVARCPSLWRRPSAGPCVPFGRDYDAEVHPIQRGIATFALDTVDKLRNSHCRDRTRIEWRRAMPDPIYRMEKSAPQMWCCPWPFPDSCLVGLCSLSSDDNREAAAGM
jgi:hypothetical protein